MPRLAPLLLTLLIGACLARCSAPAPSVGDTIVRVGSGSYATVPPPDGRGPSDADGRPATPLVTSDFIDPVPTTDWWTSLLWNHDDEPFSTDLFAHPLALRATAGGLRLWYPTTPSLTASTYFFERTDDLHVGLAGLRAGETRVAAATDWTVTAVWDDAPRRLEATFGHGLPFVYLEAPNDRAEVVPGRDAVVWHRSPETIGLTVNGHHYGLFVPVGGRWMPGDTLRSDLGASGVFSVAVLPDDDVATLLRFRRHAFAFVTDTRVRWHYDAVSAVLTTTYRATTTQRDPSAPEDAPPLLALYRHQWLHADAALTGHTYVSPRGAMRLAEGPAFTTTLTFGGVLPALADGCDAAPDTLLGRLVTAAAEAPDLAPGNLSNRDTYWSGKAVNRLAELVSLAERAGLTATRDRLLDSVQVRLEAWLSAADGGQHFVYDSTWATLIGYPAAFGSGTDLNDHHFHYGYHVLAASTLARYRPEWAAADAWGGMVELLIKDVANADRTDPRFPFLRHFDPYAGHSWASGRASYEHGNNQESTSEALAFAAAVIRWGVETSNRELRDLGIYLFTTERSAVEQYWFDVDDAVFPPGFDHSVAALVWGNGAAYDTWFGDHPAFIHGINYLPFTGASYYLGRHPDYVRRNLSELQRRLTDDPDRWIDLRTAYRALADAEAAASTFEELLGAGYRPEDGETPPHTYAWIHGLREVGTVDTTLTADVPTYRVFSSVAGRAYVAYNPEAVPRVVRFSDGFSMPVPPGTQHTHCPDG